MAEPPDFDQIARLAAPYVGDDLIERIAEQLRQVWNARGAADIATVDARMQWNSSLIDALRALDR